MRYWSVRFALLVVFLASLGTLSTASSSAAPTVDGREWRELYETTGLSWSQVASVCPTDGETPCSGTVGGKNLTGWTWATADQVRDLMDDHAPGLATADPPMVSGIEGFWAAISFLGVMRWTTYQRKHLLLLGVDRRLDRVPGCRDGLADQRRRRVLPPGRGLHCAGKHRSRHRCRCGQPCSWGVPLAPRGRLHRPGGDAHSDRHAGEQRLVPLGRLCRLVPDRPRVGDHLERGL